MHITKKNKDYNNNLKCFISTCQESTGELKARTQIHENVFLNNKIKQSNKNHPKGEKQAGRELLCS